MLIPPSSRRPTRAGAFTLVELLIVIGIIAILISILVPVVNAVRKSAYAADSRNQIQNIGNAIDRYYNDFSAYPGLFSNTAVSTAPGILIGGKRITNTENCVLSLMGGISTTAPAPYTDATPYTYAPSSLGQGALTFNSVNQKRLSAYLEATPQLLSITGSNLEPSGTFGYGQSTEVNYENMGGLPGVPEFIDRYPGSLPIIYLRARVGATGTTVVDTTGLLQYNNSEFNAYTQGNPTSVALPGDIPTASNPHISDFTDWITYFKNASLSTATAATAKRQDSYMLISPGPDRKYGTADDICNFSF